MAFMFGRYICNAVQWQFRFATTAKLIARQFSSFWSRRSVCLQTVMMVEIRCSHL